MELWNIFSVSASQKKQNKAAAGGSAPPKLPASLAVTRDATQEILKLLQKRDPESRSYKGLRIALDNLAEVFKSEDYAVSVIFFLRNNGLVTLGAKFRELPTNLLGPVFDLLIVLVESVCLRDEALAKDRDMVLGITSVLQSLLSYPIVNGALEQRLAEFLLSLASLMKVTPRLLVSWFEVIEAFYGAPSLPKKEVFEDDAEEEATAKVQYHREFPMFYLLLEYIHHGGSVGEFSQTALLHLMEVASMSEPITRWIIDSDLGGFMASGLGALYSQLCRMVSKESINYSDRVFTQDEQIHSDMSEDLETFLSYLLFWQNILNFSKDLDDLTDHLVNNFDALFVRQLLYPSIIESTDSRGGYSDALVDILATILNQLQHNRLSQLIVCYFLGQVVEDNPIVLARSKRRRPGTAGTSGSSMSSNSIHQRPVLTFSDIFTAMLESADSNTRACALKLLTVLISKYYPYIANKLISTVEMVTTIDGKGNFSRYAASLECMEELNMVQETMARISTSIVCEDEEDDTVSSNQVFFEEPSDLLLLDQELVLDYQQELEQVIVRQAECLPPPTFDAHEHHHASPKTAQYNRALYRLFGAGSLRVHRVCVDSHRAVPRSRGSEGSNGPEDSPGGRRKSSIVEFLFCDGLARYFENGFAENLALTQALVRLGACGWVDLRGWALEQLLAQVEALVAELAARRARTARPAQSEEDLRGSDGDGENSVIHHTEFAPQKNVVADGGGTGEVSQQRRQSSAEEGRQETCQPGQGLQSTEEGCPAKEEQPEEPRIALEVESGPASAETVTPDKEEEEEMKSPGVPAGEDGEELESEGPSSAARTTTTSTLGLGKWVLEMSATPFRGSQKLVSSLLSAAATAAPLAPSADKSLHPENSERDLQRIQDLNERALYEFVHELNALFHARSYIFQ